MLSGIFGFASQKSQDAAVVQTRLRRALPPQVASDEHNWLSSSGRAFLGSVHPVRIREPWHFALDPKRRVYCVFDGVIYGRAGGNGHAIDTAGASLLLDRFLQSGASFLSDLSGSFTVAWWEEEAGRLTLANDKIGNRLLFYGQQAGQLVFSSLPHRVVASGLISAEIDVEALADLLNYGYTLGDKTIYRQVRLLPPATILTFAGGRLASEQYWRLDGVAPHGRYDRQRLDELVPIFNTAVRRTLRSDLTGAIALTGGRDSRCILASAANQELDCLAHTGGQPESTDVLYARQAAQRVRVPHLFRQLDPDRMAPLLAMMVQHQGGIAATLHSHPCNIYDHPPPFDLQVEGVGGEFSAGATWQMPNMIAVRDSSEIINLLQSRVASWTLRRVDIGELFQPTWRQTYKRCLQENFALALGDYTPPHGPAGLAELLHLYERVRKFHNRSPLMIRGAIESYHPFLDHEWLAALIAIPLRDRLSNNIRVEMIRQLEPTLLKVAYEKTLISLSASPRRIKWTGRLWSLRRRLASLYPPLAPPKRVPASYDWLWSREQMRPYLTDLLYNPKANWRAYLRWEALEPLLERHFSGREDWTQLVATLVVLELAHKV